LEYSMAVLEYSNLVQFNVVFNPIVFFQQNVARTYKSVVKYTQNRVFVSLPILSSIIRLLQSGLFFITFAGTSEYPRLVNLWLDQRK